MSYQKTYSLRIGDIRVLTWDFADAANAGSATLGTDSLTTNPSNLGPVISFPTMATNIAAGLSQTTTKGTINSQTVTHLVTVADTAVIGQTYAALCTAVSTGGQTLIVSVAVLVLAGTV